MGIMIDKGLTETQTTFCRTRYEYDSYEDLFRLVKLSGFDTIFVDELDLSKPGVFIVTPCNGEWRPHVDNQREKLARQDIPQLAHLILWNLERPDGSAGSVGQYAQSNLDLIAKRHVDEVWVSDRKLAEETISRFVPLGSDYGLGEPSKKKSYKFCHMSYETSRRVSIYKHFSGKDIGPNSWPPERNEILKRSKFALNVHQDQHPFQEPLRFALFAAYGLPTVSEDVYDAYPWSEEFMVFTKYLGLVGKLNQMLEDDYARWWEMGQRARKRMCEDFQFGKMVRQAVKESVGVWR